MTKTSLCVTICVLACFSTSLGQTPECSSCAPTPTQDTINYTTLHFESQLDHFDFSNTQTFQLRYLVNDRYWDSNGGPIFFYTGNEANIEMFCNNTGIVWENAPAFKAMIVFAEHRFYGETLPFGSKTYKDPHNLRFLTAEQALADYAELIRHIKRSVKGAAHSKVVSFGGSYGGMLSAWFRIKYPNVVVGAVTGGSPVFGFREIAPSCKAFPESLTAVWKNTSPVCATNINRAYNTLDKMAGEAGGLKTISKMFNMCTPMKTPNDLMAFKAVLAYTYIKYAWANYPYAASLMEPLPAWPIKEACKYLSTPLEGKELISGLAKVVNLYHNYTGQISCFDALKSTSVGLQTGGFLYQICTELAFPVCPDGTGILFKFDSNASSKVLCTALYQVRPRPDWVPLQFWGKDLKAASNIIFSNGDLDPTTSLGVTSDVSDSVVAIMVKGGAHHLDFRWKNKADNLSVKLARTKEMHLVRKWLK